MNRQLLLLALLAAATSVSAEQVYKWTDQGGIVHYSDAPPPADALNVQTVRVTGGDRPHTLNMGGSTDTAAKSADTTKAPPPPTNLPDTPENRAQNCKQARSNLDILQSKYPVSMAGSDGKTQTLDDKSRQTQIAAANAQIAQYCQ